MKVTRKDQVTIPKAARNRLSIKPGSQIEFAIAVRWPNIST